MFVSFITIACHAYPSKHRTVRTPHGISVITALHINYRSLAGLYIIYIDLCVCRECILLSHKLAARICDELSVRTPVELLKSAERFGRKFEKLTSLAKDICGILRVHLLVSTEAEVGDISVRNLHDSMVPMPVKEVVGRVGSSFAELRIKICRSLYVTLYITDVHHLFLVGRKLELSDS